MAKRTAVAEPTLLGPETMTWHREMEVAVDRAALQAREDGTDDRIPIALSSETPVERYDWWEGKSYLEILDHGPKSVDLSYARDGLPFLLNHDTREQIGIIEDVKLEDRKIRGLVRFSRSAQAQEIRTDMLDGIRKKVSVGYRLSEEFDQSEQDGKLVRRYRNWKPLEGSSVPVPADYDVGIGRSLAGGRAPAADDSPPHRPSQAKETPMSDQDTAARGGAGSDAAPPKGTVGADQNQERTARLAFIAQVANRTADLPKWLIEGRSVDSVEKEVREQMERDAIARATATAPPGHVDLSPKEQREYSLTRAIMAAAEADWRNAPFEKEVAETALAQMARAPGGKERAFDSRRVILPLNLQVRASVTGNVAGTSSLGGAGVQTTVVLPLIEILRNRMKVRELGATVLTGLTDNITFPRQITANTFTWTGENPSSAVTDTAATFDNVALSPKTGMSASAYSKQTLLQFNPSIDQVVANDLMLVAALGIDLACLSGTGSSNQPKGIASQTGVIAVTMGAAGAVPAWANIVNYETQVATNNADFGTFAFLTTPGIRGVMKQTLKSTAVVSPFIWEGNNTMNGYRAEVSNQCRSNLTKGTSTTICHEIFYGDWSQLLIGEFGGAVEIVVDPYKYLDQNMIRLVSFVMVDCNVRLPKAFAYTADALTS